MRYDPDKTFSVLVVLQHQPRAGSDPGGGRASGPKDNGSN
jgi:hypothetical protein